MPLRPVMFDESCLRGYACNYALTGDSQLILAQLFTNNGDEGGPRLYEKKPVGFHSPAGVNVHELSQYFGGIYSITFKGNASGNWIYGGF